MKADILKNFSIYRIYYSNWNTTRAPIAFILYVGKGSKVHCIYLNAPQMDSFARMKFISILKRLKDLNVKWTPRMFFSVLKKYAPEVLRNGYRTLWKYYIVRLALINYGLNTEKDFSEKLLKESLNDKPLFQSKDREIYVKILDRMTERGITRKKFNEIFAQIKEKEK